VKAFRVFILSILVVLYSSNTFTTSDMLALVKEAPWVGQVAANI